MGERDFGDSIKQRYLLRHNIFKAHTIPRAVDSGHTAYQHANQWTSNWTFIYMKCKDELLHCV